MLKKSGVCFRDIVFSFPFLCTVSFKLVFNFPIFHSFFGMIIPDKGLKAPTQKERGQCFSDLETALHKFSEC